MKVNWGLSSISELRSLTPKERKQLLVWAMNTKRCTGRGVVGIFAVLAFGIILATIGLLLFGIDQPLLAVLFSAPPAAMVAWFITIGLMRAQMVELAPRMLSYRQNNLHKA